MLTRRRPSFVDHYIRRCFSIVGVQLSKSVVASVKNDCIVEISERDENALQFPGVWLRDNCQCEFCFHSHSQSRQINWNKFNPKVKVLSAIADENTGKVNIHWDDDHSWAFDLQWLKSRNFSPENRKMYLSEFYRPTAKPWGKTDFEKIVSYFDYNELVEDNGALKNWLETLAINGVAIIKNTPQEKTALRLLSDRVGFIRKTTYGEEVNFIVKPGATNYAYISQALPMHTDLPYYEYKPGVNMLHCLVQSESKGGGNRLADGFHIAERLKFEFPEYFKVLTETIVDWNDIGSEDQASFHNIFRAPVICLDDMGNYSRINHSINQRDNHFTVDIEKVLPWYEASAKFIELMNEEAVTFKSKPGEILTFNNIRLVHGRNGYDDSQQNVRYIVGAFLDWDIIYSKIRVLKKLESLTKQ